MHHTSMEVLPESQIYVLLSSCDEISVPDDPVSGSLYTKLPLFQEALLHNYYFPEWTASSAHNTVPSAASHLPGPASCHETLQIQQ